MLHLFSPANPRRPVNWRFERARSIAEGGPPLSRRTDDAWVHKAYRFRQMYNACNTEADHYTCAFRYPDIYWAHDIWHATGSDDPVNPGPSPFKSELEARLLADDATDNIAARLATTPEMVVAYERLFFNIAERRHNRGYLMHQVIGPVIYSGVQEQDYDVLWKLFAIMGGPLVLDMMIDGAVPGPRPADAAGLVAFLGDTTQNAIRRKAMLVATTTKINQFNAVEMIGAFLKLVEIERVAGRSASGSESLLSHIGMMLDALPIQVGGRAQHVDVPELGRYDSHAAELRSEEVAALGMGRDAPALRMLGQFAYPAATTAPDAPPAEGSDR